MDKSQENFQGKGQFYEKAATAYRTTYVSNISGFEIVAELYQGMLGNIEQAKNAYQCGKLDQFCRLNEKTYRILIALQSHLDFDQGGDAAVFLNNFYNSIFVSLAKIHKNQDPPQEFDRIIQFIRPVYQQWYALASSQKEQSNNQAISS
ncbi:MAG: flagellar protein FliS [Alphaproteobacteria bacterium]|nr:flagellar protein FliS [Alphaproteobacteria bacterium]